MFVLKKRAVSFILAVVLLFFQSSAPAQAESSLDFSYIVVGNEITINGYTGSSTSITIPETIAGKSVTTIGDYVLMNNEQVTTIHIPARITKISSMAFSNCPSLKVYEVSASNTVYSSVDGVLMNKKQDQLLRFPDNKSTSTYLIPANVTTLGDYAFNSSNLSKISLPKTITTIGSNAFSASSITEVTLSDSMTSISAYMFSDCHNLTKVNIPEILTTIEWAAFQDCTSLASFTIGKNVSEITERSFANCPKLTGFVVDPTNATYSSVDGVLFSKDLTKLITYPTGKLGKSYLIPLATKEIGASAFFYNSTLEKATFQNSVEQIDSMAFDKCVNLKTVILPKSLLFIDEYAFRECNSLSTITIPQAVLTIKDTAFDKIKPVIIGYPASVGESFALANSYKFQLLQLLATPTQSTIYVNTVPTQFEAYNIDGNNFFKLRDLSMILNGTQTQFNVFYNPADNSINIVRNSAYVPVGGELIIPTTLQSTMSTVSSSKIIIDGQLTSFTIYNIKGNNYFKLRDVGKVINFSVSWDNTTSSVVIDSSKVYTE